MDVKARCENGGLQRCHMLHCSQLVQSRASRHRGTRLPNFFLHPAPELSVLAGEEAPLNVRARRACVFARRGRARAGVRCVLPSFLSRCDHIYEYWDQLRFTRMGEVHEREP